MSENREAGWYWCKDFDHPNPEYWECMYWSGDDWEGPDPMVVGPRIPTPDEPWQTVPVEPTTKQIGAGIEAYDGRCEDSYRAMLAAAPKPGGE